MINALKKWYLVMLSLFMLTFFLLLIEQPKAYLKVYGSFAGNTIDEDDDLVKTADAQLSSYDQLKWRGLTDKQISKLSKLGEILYMDKDPPAVDTSWKNYTILIWKYGPSLEKRHIKHYTNQRFDPFENCSVKNCHITYSSTDLPFADLVLFHLHRTRGVQELPTGKRNSSQIWAFLTDESPFHTFLHSKNNTLKNYNGFFNWSMTYRMDSDIPVPYGRTVKLTSEEMDAVETLDEWNRSKRQDVLVAIMGSNCGGKNHRWGYVRELEKYIPVDKYGACGTLKCPGHFATDCKELLKYKFYLSFENSNCDEYVTEKLWWNGYAKDAIPIVMGTSKDICQQLLPPNSYIHVNDFASPRDLANYIFYLNRTSSELAQYFTWKKYFKVLNEHGYFRTTSVHYCRICEALNYNRKDSKVYADLTNFWSQNDCQESWDAQGS